METVATLRSEIGRLTEEQYVARRPEPGFLFGPPAPRQGREGPEAWFTKTSVEEHEAFDPDRTVSIGVGDLGLTPSPEVDPEALELRGVVAYIKKGRATLFPDMVTLGRVPNNDIVLGYPTVSKVHAYLRRTGDVWWIYDQRSTNGTFVDQQRVTPGGSRRLQDGALVGLGPSLAMTFLLPASLYGYLRGAGPGTFGARG